MWLSAEVLGSSPSTANQPSNKHTHMGIGYISLFAVFTSKLLNNK